MSTIREINRAQIHEVQVKKIREHIIEQVEKVKQQAFAAREQMIQRRAEKIEQVRKKLNDTTRLIQEKHDMIKIKLNQETIHREANLRVDRGLEALEKFVQVLRDSSMGDDMWQTLSYDPLISGSVKTEARKTLVSDFVKSIQKQVVMQTEFINIAAHELRTPIMPILVNVEILEETIGSNNPELKIITRNAKRLQRLTENILSVARIETNSLRLNKAPFDLNLVLSEAIKDESVQGENKNISFVHKAKNDKILVAADRDMINQVVFNLLHNAIKFTSEGSISITSEIVDNTAIVSIEDNGQGIDPQVFPILFSKFATKSEKGTGLGLYISKNIIEAHGGKIWAINNRFHGKEGATFKFSLPLT